MGPMKLAFFVLAKILRMGYQPDTDRVLALGFQFNKVTYGTLIKRFCNLPLSSGRVFLNTLNSGIRCYRIS
ncbi:Pentatricopeptide (PPR) repeat protein [Arachis hypogaea]|nr:Pentatricopeptide (PPR) repeat protein [Arachis hypogaea]